MKTDRGTHTAHTLQRRFDAMRREEKGFTILDVIIGAAILGFVVVGTMQFFAYGQVRIRERAEERSAYDLARTRIEEVLASHYDAVVSRVDSGLTVYGGVAAVRTTTVTFVDDPTDSLGASDADGPEDFKNVQVDVGYRDKTVMLQTFVLP